MYVCRVGCWQVPAGRCSVAMVTTKPLQHRIQLLKVPGGFESSSSGSYLSSYSCGGSQFGQDLYADFLTADYINKRLNALEKQAQKAQGGKVDDQAGQLIQLSMYKSRPLSMNIETCLHAGHRVLLLGREPRLCGRSRGLLMQSIRICSTHVCPVISDFTWRHKHCYPYYTSSKPLHQLPARSLLTTTSASCSHT